MSIPNFYIDSSNAYRNSMYDEILCNHKVSFHSRMLTACKLLCIIHTEKHAYQHIIYEPRLHRFHVVSVHPQATGTLLNIETSYSISLYDVHITSCSTGSTLSLYQRNKIALFYFPASSITWIPNTISIIVPYTSVPRIITYKNCIHEIKKEEASGYEFCGGADDVPCSGRTYEI